MVRIGSKESSSRRFALLAFAASVAALLVVSLVWLYAVFAAKLVSDFGRLRGGWEDNRAISVHKKGSYSAASSSSAVRDNASRKDSPVANRPLLHPGCLRPVDLSDADIHPTAGSRHMVDPPNDSPATPPVLVCCSTTKGPLSIVAHPSWAPLGAGRFLDMVKSGSYFSTGIPLFRCLRGFLCQFGIPGDPEVGRVYRVPLSDDPNWLPEGPKHRTNERGVKRFAKGYLAYAGAGPHSRTEQFILALKDQERLAGGSPWEVPWGEIVGAASFETIDKFYTGYGEKGPSQGILHKQGANEEVKTNFPEMDYITGCELVDDASDDSTRGKV